ncbi:MAG: TonB-dependent receptor [Chitinispirillaceae bacterium]|nr:TonB-dependent receptor [Chitinispirillaceae bacterium]
MSYLGKKMARMYPVTTALFCLAIIVYSQDEIGGTDMSLEDLVNVKISIASKTEENISDAPGVVSVITQDQLKRFGGTTLGDVLKRVPGFLGTTVYMTDRSAIASRGDQVMPSSSHILLLINGRPIREILEGGIKSEVYETFPVNVIERIEVIRGPGSVLYGSQAFSAVINVVTKSPERNCVSVSGSLGENFQNNINANINYKIGDFGIVLAGRYGDKSGWQVDWEAPNAMGGIDTVKVTVPDYGPGAFAELSFKGLRLMCSFNQWNNQNFISDYQQFKGAPFFPEGDATGRVTWKKLFGDLGYEHSFSDKYSFSLNTTYTRSLFETSMFPWTSRDAYELIIEETNFFKPFDNFNIVLGGTWAFMTGWEGDARDKDIKFNSGHEQNSFTGYLQADYRWNWCKLIGGIQFNKVAEFDPDFNPRAGLILFPIENVNFKALYSTAYRAPSLDELYLDHPTMRGQMVKRVSADGNQERNLTPEKVNTFDMGINYQDDVVQFGLNGFHSRMKNLIIQDRDLNRYSIPTWDNIGEVSIFGLECEGKYYLSKELFFEGSILYQESKDENTSEEHVTPLPVFSAKGGLSYSGNGLILSVFNTYWQALEKKYSSTLNKTTGYFNMVNMNCSYNLNHLLKSTVFKDLSLVLTVDNLLDVEVWLPGWGLENFGNRIPYNEGRTIYGGIKVTF